MQKDWRFPQGTRLNCRRDQAENLVLLAPEGHPVGEGERFRKGVVMTNGGLYLAG